MYSVILPTMWKSNVIENLISVLNRSSSVGEIILIDNDCARTNHSLLKLHKVKYFPQIENIYVNPSWNLGVKNSTFEKVIILNDDIDLSFEFLENIDLEPETIIGTNADCYKNDCVNLKVVDCAKREWGWGCMLIFRKSDWVEIPEDLKIWCGDDFIFENFKFRKQIIGLPIKTKMSTTSDLKQFDEVKNNDLKIWHAKYSKK